MEISRKMVGFNKSSEKRKYPRFDPQDQLRANFASGGCEIEGSVSQLSLAGFFLAIRDGGVAESEGIVSMKLPEWLLTVKAAIRTVVPGLGFGVEFLDMPPRDRQVLVWYCHYLSFTGV